MVFPILGGNGAVATYSIDNSVRLNDNDSAGFSRTNQASPTDAKIFTWSGWVKRGNIDTSSALFAGNSGSNISNLYFRGSGTQNYIRLVETSDTFSTYDTLIDTQMLFRDVGAWYHVVLKYDSTNGTANDRAIIYVNGVQVDLTISNTVDSNYTSPLNEGSYSNYVGRASGGNYQDGYMAEINFIDGQALSPTDFGEFDEDSGIWKPIRYSGSYGTNGFKLDFSDSGSLGADSSPNGNNFTPTNLASTDQTTDTPTNNFATLNPLVFTSGGANYSEGNVKVNTNDATRSGGVSTQGVSIGKWYWEIKLTSGASNSQLGISYNPQELTRTTTAVGETADSWSYVPPTGKIRNNAVDLFSASTLADSDIMNIALDLDNNYVYFGKNGTWQNSGDPTSGASGTGGFSLTAGEEYFFIGGDRTTGGGATQEVNFGNPSFSISSGNSDDNGYGNFEYAPPSGYLALCTQNLATELSPTIDDGSEYFHTQLYTGNGVDDTAITNDAYSGDFQPDFLWIKERSSTSAHRIFDSSRGASIRLEPNANLAEATDTSNMKSFDTDGFTLGTSGSTNANGDTYVAWQLKASGGSTSSNTDGSITSTVQAGGGGFSIVTYTGTGANATVGHGLGVAPKMIIVKRRSGGTADWYVYHSSIGATKNLRLNKTDASSTDSTIFNNTEPTSSVFSLGSSFSNTSGLDYIAYCFAEIEGYSKFGSYTGNGSNGNFAYLGFKPAFLIIKNTSDGDDEWLMWDNKRDTYNAVDNYLLPSNSTAEAVDSSWAKIDFLSNGFNVITSDISYNQSGYTYIYMAFAENPFVSSTGIPVTAR